MTDSTTDTTIETTNTTTETTPVARGRGRRKVEDGGAKSPRPVKVVCAAIVNDEIVMSEYDAEPGTLEPSDVIIAAAKKEFAKTNGVLEEDVSTKGPFYPRLGVLVPKEKKREVGPSIDLTSIVFKPGHGTAVYKDWNVTVRLIEGNDDSCWIIFKTHMKEDKKSLPNSRAAFIKDLDGLVMQGA